MNEYLTVLKKYAVFTGRARRKEYWMFFLFNIIFGIAAGLVDRILHTNYRHMSYGIIYTLYVLAVFIPGLAVGVRRLHDIDKSGWWIFVALIPLIGWIWLLVLCCTEGTRGRNAYGEDPKEVVYEQS